jgi:hypothetical protein
MSGNGERRQEGEAVSIRDPLCGSYGRCEGDYLARPAETNARWLTGLTRASPIAGDFYHSMQCEAVESS